MELFCWIFIGCCLVYFYKEIDRRDNEEIKRQLKKRRQNVRFTKKEIDMMRKNYEKTVNRIKKNARSEIQSIKCGVPKKCSFCEQIFSSGNRLHNHLKTFEHHMCADT